MSEQQLTLQSSHYATRGSSSTVAVETPENDFNDLTFARPIPSVDLSFRAAVPRSRSSRSRRSHKSRRSASEIAERGSLAEDSEYNPRPYVSHQHHPSTGDWVTRENQSSARYLPHSPNRDLEQTGTDVTTETRYSPPSYSDGSTSQYYSTLSQQPSTQYYSTFSSQLSPDYVYGWNFPGQNYFYYIDKTLADPELLHEEREGRCMYWPPLGTTVTGIGPSPAITPYGIAGPYKRPHEQLQPQAPSFTPRKSLSLLDDKGLAEYTAGTDETRSDAHQDAQRSDANTKSSEPSSQSLKRQSITDDEKKRDLREAVRKKIVEDKQKDRIDKEQREDETRNARQMKEDEEKAAKQRIEEQREKLTRQRKEDGEKLTKQWMKEEERISKRGAKQRIMDDEDKAAKERIEEEENGLAKQREDDDTAAKSRQNDRKEEIQSFLDNVVQKSRLSDRRVPHGSPDTKITSTQNNFLGQYADNTSLSQHQLDEPTENLGGKGTPTHVNKSERESTNQLVLPSDHTRSLNKTTGKVIRPPPGLPQPAANALLPEPTPSLHSIVIQERLRSSNGWFHTDFREKEPTRRQIAEVANSYAEKCKDSRQDTTNVKATTLLLGNVIETFHEYAASSNKEYPSYFVPFGDVDPRYCDMESTGLRSYFETTGLSTDETSIAQGHQRRSGSSRQSYDKPEKKMVLIRSRRPEL